VLLSTRPEFKLQYRQNKIYHEWLHMVAHPCNPRTLETEANSVAINKQIFFLMGDHLCDLVYNLEAVLNQANIATGYWTFEASHLQIKIHLV
jgi:hypothetical protein